VSDVDELICKRALERALSGGVHFFAMEHFCDYRDGKIAPSDKFLWTKTYANSAASILAMPNLWAPREVDPAAYLRSVGIEPNQAGVADAGGHFSWMGAVDRHLEKMNAFFHQV
jgi:hypothetical protein